MHERPASLGLYARQRDHRSVDLTHEIHLDHAPELLGPRPGEGGEEADGREVHPGVEPTVLLDRLLRNRFDLVEFRYVGGYGRGLSALGPYLLY